MSTESNEFEGKNLDVAVWKASQELEIAIEKLRYKILEKGRRGHGDDPGSPARIRILTAEEAEAAVTAAPARQEPSRERPPRRESRPERSRSRREEEQADDEAKEVEEVAEETAADDDRDEAADEIVADAGDAEADEATEDEPDVDDEADEAIEDEPDVDDEDLDEPPSASSALLEDDDPIEIAREARRRSAQAREERVDEADNGDKAEQPADEEPADDEPAVEARRPRREPRPRRRSARARDERVEETDGGDEPADDEPQVEAREPRREPRRERPSRHRESRRPEGALDPDDLESGLEKAREIIPQLLSQMGFDLEMDAEIQEDHIYVPLQGEDCKFLLEHRAEGLNALQFLVNKMAYRGGPTRILVDADGYRKERQEELVERAHAVADEVRDGGNSQSLGSLNPFERRLVHMALRDDEDVRTVSKGEGFLKRMEIVPKHGGDGDESQGSERRPRRRRERY